MRLPHAGFTCAMMEGSLVGHDGRHPDPVVGDTECIGRFRFLNRFSRCG